MKTIRSQLSNAVSTIPVRRLDQKLSLLLSKNHSSSQLYSDVSHVVKNHSERVSLQYFTFYRFLTLFFFLHRLNISNFKAFGWFLIMHYKSALGVCDQTRK